MAVLIKGLFDEVVAVSDLKWDKTFALEQVEDDTGLLQELVTILIQACLHDLGLIKSGIAEGNQAEVRCAVHSIKGASASLGIIGLRDLAQFMEGAALRGNLEQVASRIPELETMIDDLKKI